MQKSSVEEIRARFDADVERFSNLETGQTAAVDGGLAIDLITAAAAACNPQAKSLLDIGCGAGNFSLRLLEHLPQLDVTLIDLSQPMLDRAEQRLKAVARGKVTTLQTDIREVELGRERFDVVVVAAVLHHLRMDAEWSGVFAKIHAALRPGGSFWIFDMIESTLSAVNELMRERYGKYLAGFKDEAYRDHVFAYIEQEDTPQSLMFQLDLLRKVGFTAVEVLHKNTNFAAFGAVK